MKSLVFAAGAAFLATSAVAADLSAPVPQTRIVQDDCAYVEVRMHNWNREAVFRVTAVGGKVPNGWVQTPVRLAAGGTRLCVPRAFFYADIVEICIGDTSRDNSNSRLIQNNWMQIARSNLAKGDVVNPGKPMNFRYNGSSDWQRGYAGTQRQNLARGSHRMQPQRSLIERRLQVRRQMHSRMVIIQPPRYLRHRQMHRPFNGGWQHHQRGPVVVHPHHARPPHLVRPHVVY